MLSLNRTRQLKQLRRLDAFAARRVDAAIKGGHLALAETGIVKGLQEAARNIHQRMTAEIHNAAQAAVKPVAPYTPPTEAEFAQMPASLGDSITQLLGGDHLAERERLNAPTLIRKPTKEESERALKLALSPGGGGGMSRQVWSIGMGYGRK